ncbi:MAG: ribonuclease J [Anaerolineae bacterium]|nr:ribonuclease J [Anaerolineae bacterium]
MSQSFLRVIPLGGLGEVGRNMTVYEYQGKLLVVDAGIMFPLNSMPGIDYIIPDMQYLVEHREDVVGVVFTHGHEDHIGAVQYLVEKISAPLFATRLTRGLIEVKLARQGLLERISLNEVEAGQQITIGPFQVDFFHVCHSIPDCIGLAIDTPAGLVVHTGDYKFDQTPVDNWPTDFAALAEFSERGVLALLSDSTNAENVGWTASERMIDDALEQVFLNAKGRIIIASFASLISRMQQVANAAQRHGRKLAFAGPSMIDNSRMARDLGYLTIPKDSLVTVDQALSMKDDKVVIMCTGSQGEPTSILGRLSMGHNRQFDIEPGDTVVLSSHTIPGNEESVYHTINRLFERGADVIYERISPVHVSGHASQEEMKLLLNLVKPKYLIPIHGELRHLKAQAAIGQQMGIPADHIAVIQNGQVVEFENEIMYLAPAIPYSYVFVDGRGVGDVGEDVVRERETLGQDGVVFIHMVINQHSRLLDPEVGVQSFGFMDEYEAEVILDEVRKRVSQFMQEFEEVPEDLEHAVVKIARSYIFDEVRRRPRIFVAIHRIEAGTLPYGNNKAR